MTVRIVSAASAVSPGRRLPDTIRRCRTRLMAVGMITALAVLGGCEPPTEVIDLRDAPQATRDAMLRVQIFPLGTQAPANVGSIGAISGLGCGPTSVAAEGAAIEQLRVKALRMHATAVVDVVNGPADMGSCLGGSGAIVNGVAVGRRGIPSPY